MSSESDQMLMLLQEKSTLKNLDEEYAARAKTAEDNKSHHERKRRHAEIAKEIIHVAELAKQEKNECANSPG